MLSLKTKLTALCHPIVPFVSVTDGNAHPRFPLTLLSFWLLTEDELDDLAYFYHQVTTSDIKYRYPHPVDWDLDASPGS
jgi:hypothetical protein